MNVSEMRQAKKMKKMRKKTASLTKTIGLADSPIFGLADFGLADRKKMRIHGPKRKSAEALLLVRTGRR